MKVNLKQLSGVFAGAINQASAELKDDFNLEFCTYWTNSFEQGQKLSAPEPIVKDIRKDVERVMHLKHNDNMSYEDFESLGNVIKAIGLQREKNKIMASRTQVSRR